MRKSQVRESVIHPTSSIRLVTNNNAIHPIPEESQAENETDTRETMKTMGTKGSSYGVTLTHRTENSPKETSKYR